MASTPVRCPHCNADLDLSSNVSNYGLVPAESDPEGKARLDLILECDECGRGWNVFVPVEDFFANPIDEAPR